MDASGNYLKNQNNDMLYGYKLVNPEDVSNNQYESVKTKHPDYNITLVLFLSFVFMVNCIGGENGDSTGGVGDSKELARMQQIFRKSLKTRKKQVNCKKPQFQLNPMCMHAKRLPRRFWHLLV